MKSHISSKEQKSIGRCCSADNAKSFSFTENRKQKTENIFTRLVLLLIRAYQLLVAPLLPNCCRFAPTCSHYAAEALHRYGFWRGSWLSLRRLARCHPFHPGGWDPVP